jgi:hypothetical protein
MPPFLLVLTWVAIALSAAAAGIALFLLASPRVKRQHADAGEAHRWWRTVRVSCGVILALCSRWTGGAPMWLLLAAGIWLFLVWDLASWLRTRYRLTRPG